MLSAEMNDRDYLVDLSNTQVEISNLKSAADILHSLVHNDGDEAHLKWMADKLLDDAYELSKRFSKAFDAKIASLRQVDGLAQAAE